MKKKEIKKKLNKMYEVFINTPEVQYERVYERPSRIKSLLIFIFNLITLILLIRIGFRINIIYLSIFIVNFGIMIFSGINVFTKEGIKLPKYKKVVENEKDDKE